MKITYSYLDDSGEIVTNTEINPGMHVTDAERVEMGVNQREAEHHAAQTSYSWDYLEDAGMPFGAEYPDEGGMFLVLIGAFVVFAVLALVVIGLAQGAL